MSQEAIDYRYMAGAGILPYAPETHGRWAARAWLRRTIGQPVLYPDIYIWYVFFASMDVMLTWVILHFKGAELNPIAHWVIDHYDLVGMVAYKFLLLFFVVAVCEYVGRIQHRAKLSHRLAEISVAITAFPVVVAVSLLLYKLSLEGAVWEWQSVVGSAVEDFYAPTTATVLHPLPRY